MVYGRVGYYRWVDRTAGREGAKLGWYSCWGAERERETLTLCMGLVNTRSLIRILGAGLGQGACPF